MRNHKLFLTAALFIIFLASGMLRAEEKKEVIGWQKSLVGNLNFTQSQFDNWEQGGENSWSWQLDIDGKFDYNQPAFKWANSGKLSFGKARVAGARARKAADEIKFESVYSRKLGLYVNPYVAATGITQFTTGYKYASDTSKQSISDYFDPAYFTQSFGVGYDPNDFFKIRIGASIKETIADRYANMYSKGEEFRVEYGAELVSDGKVQLNSIMLYNTKLALFSSLKRIDEVDVNWEHTISAQVAKYLNVNFNFRLYYDKDVSLQRQIKQTLAVGLTYSFI